jgi:hypothetical protein
MAKIVEVYVHGEGSREPKLVKVSEDATLREVAEAAGCHLERVEDLFIGRQDDDDPCHSEDPLHKAKVGHRHHIHCHRCKKIHVSVLYNGIQKEREFSPAVRLDRVLRWATHEFGLHGQDAADMALFLPGETQPLDGDIHIGSLASFPHCRVAFTMNVPVLVNGS